MRRQRPVATRWVKFSAYEKQQYSVCRYQPSSPATIVPCGFTLGLDLGDRSHHVCVLDATGQIVREGALPNTRPALAQLLADFPRATVALEAGTHSPWISRYLTAAHFSC